MENWAHQEQTVASWGIFFHIPSDACLPISDYNEELLGVNPDPASVDGKYPIDFTWIGFHPIKRVLARFTGMPVPPCLQQAAVKPHLSKALWQPHRPDEESGEPEAGAVAASRGSQMLPVAAAAPPCPFCEASAESSIAQQL